MLSLPLQTLKKQTKMKKLLFSALVILLTIGTANAQTPVKYHGEVDLGYSLGVGTFAAGRVNLHTIQGVRIGEYFSTGIGLGLDFYHEGPELMVPVYLNLKGYLPVTSRVSPYFSLDIGAGVGASAGVSGLSGATYTPAVGIRVGRFKAQIGYNAQCLSESGVSITMGALQIKAGVTF